LAAAAAHTDPGVWTAKIYALSGESERARAVLNEAVQKPDEVAPAYMLAEAAAVLGDLDECFRLLDRAYENNRIPLQGLRNALELEAMRRDPRFMRLLKKMNLAQRDSPLAERSPA